MEACPPIKTGTVNALQKSSDWIYRYLFFVVLATKNPPTHNSYPLPQIKILIPLESTIETTPFLTAEANSGLIYVNLTTLPGTLRQC
jgi:hypothetical protein